MKLVAVQIDITWEQRDPNHRKVRQLLEADRPERGSLVVLPEMFASGFSMNVGAIREDETRPTERFLSEVAREFGVSVVGGLVTQGTLEKGRNEALAFGPDGKLLTRYAKMHPFCLGGEPQHYEAGGQVVTFRWHDFVVAPFICYDLRFPEIFRQAARRGANLFVVIANWPEARIRHWITLLQARAIENQAYVVGVNRTGRDPAHQYSGRSLIVDYTGAILVNAGEGEEIIAADLSAAALNQYRAEFPFLTDIRDDVLHP